MPGSMRNSLEIKAVIAVMRMGVKRTMTRKDFDLCSTHSFLITIPMFWCAFISCPHVAQGYTNAAIGQALYIDIKTVEQHLSSVYCKLKEDPQFADKHPRVSAAKLYLETMGELGWGERLLVGTSA